MNKGYIFLGILLLMGSFVRTHAQLIENDEAPDWILPDISGQSHHLYQYLDMDKPVILYFFDAGVPPCWTYHNTNALQDLYTEYGPGGKDSLSVFYIETNPTTTDDNIKGIIGPGQPSNITAGDWTASNPCPIINLQSDTLLSKYKLLGDYPTVITVCQERLVKLSGQRTAAQHYDLLGACMGLITDTLDIYALQYLGPYYLCWNHLNHPTMRIQNRGSKPLTEGTLKVVYVQSQQLFWSEPWTGNLAPYKTEVITLPRMTLMADGLYRFEFAPNPTISLDATPNNNQAYWGVSVFPNYAIYDTLLNLELVTDQYGEEVTWQLFSDNNQVVMSGGPYPHLENPGTAAYTIPIALTKGLCYRFVIKDKFGDGVCCDYGNGYFRLKDSWGSTIAQGDTMFLEETGYVSTGYAVSTEEQFVKNLMEIYPSPAVDEIYVEIPEFITPENATIEIRNAMGQEVYRSEVTAKKQRILVRDFSSGVYFLRLNFEKGTLVAPFLKEKY